MRHLVAYPVGTPAQRKLGKVARADHDAAVVVGQPEQVVGAQARLHVLERDVVLVGTIGIGVPDVAQHLDRRRFDVEFGRGDAQRLHQRPGVALGVFRGCEARHGERHDIGARQFQLVEGLGADDQRLGGVQPAGDADHHFLYPRRLQSLHEAGDLDVVGFVTILFQARDIGGDEGEAFDCAEEADILRWRRQREADGAVLPRIAAAVGVEGAHLEPLLPE